MAPSKSTKDIRHIVFDEMYRRSNGGKERPNFDEFKRSCEEQIQFTQDESWHQVIPGLEDESTESMRNAIRPKRNKGWVEAGWRQVDGNHYKPWVQVDKIKNTPLNPKENNYGDVLLENGATNSTTNHSGFDGTVGLPARSTSEFDALFNFPNSNTAAFGRHYGNMEGEAKCHGKIIDGKDMLLEEKEKRIQ